MDETRRADFPLALAYRVRRTVEGAGFGDKASSGCSYGVNGGDRS